MMRLSRALKIATPLVFIILIVFFLQSDLVQENLSNPERIQEFVLGFGLLAPLAVVFLQAFQTTISIIPSQITTIIAGFVFGPILGLTYSLIGAFFGSSLIFFVGRKYGQELEHKIFDNREIKHFNLFFKQKKKWALFLARIAPIFPNDLVSFAAGLTNIRFRDFNLISTCGFIVQMSLLVFFGSELSSGKVSLPLIIISSLISMLILVTLFKGKIKKLVIKDLHKVEKDVEKMPLL